MAFQFFDRSKAVDRMKADKVSAEDVVYYEEFEAVRRHRVAQIVGRSEPTHPEDDEFYEAMDAVGKQMAREVVVRKVADSGR